MLRDWAKGTEEEENNNLRICLY